MNLFKYNQFLNSRPINENLDKAKKFMKDRYLLVSTAAKLGFLKGELEEQLKHKEKLSVSLKDFTPDQQTEIRNSLKLRKLTDLEIKKIESDPQFKKIRELFTKTLTGIDPKTGKPKTIESNLGWMYPFTYFYFVEMVPIEELKSLLNKLVDCGDLLNKLPKKFDSNFIDLNLDNNAEILIDGLDNLENYRNIKKVIDQLTPDLKKDYNAAPLAIKNQFAEIAIAFIQLGGGDQVQHDKLWKSFFGEVRTVETDQEIYGKFYKKGEKRYFGPLNRYKNIREFIIAAQGYIKSSQNSDIVDFYDKIDKCNQKYGQQGADIVFDENGILILDVKSFVTNQMLNGHTRHCIKDNSSQWESYVNSNFGKQYYIYNFNIPQYDNMSVIGITIEPNQKIRAAHAKNDQDVSNSIKRILNGWEKEYGIFSDIFKEALKSMTKEEIEKRERAKIAERKIVEKGLSIEEITKYVKEDGANINKDSCAALEHAVVEGDLEKAKAILDLGGNPNLRAKSEAIINKAFTLEMIKLLVSHHADLTGAVFDNISDSTEAVEYCLTQGLDPNFDNSLPIRRSCKGSYKPKDNDGYHNGEGYFDVFKILHQYGARLGDDLGRNMGIKWASEYGRFDFMDYMIDNGVVTGFKNSMGWLGHSRKMSDDDKKMTARYLYDKINKYEPVTKDEMVALLSKAGFKLSDMESSKEEPVKKTRKPRVTKPKE